MRMRNNYDRVKTNSNGKNKSHIKKSSSMRKQQNLKHWANNKDRDTVQSRHK